jgi:hypothetical protein
MRVLVCDPPPPAFEAFLEERRRTGADRRDEIWDGVLHVAPAPQRRHGTLLMRIAALLQPLAGPAGLEIISDFNIGEPQDYRIPDAGLLRSGPNVTFLLTAAMAIEIVSPRDDTWDKLPFYAEHDIDELLIVDPETRKVDWLGLADGKYAPIGRSGLIDLGPEQLAAQIDWPPLTD